MPHQWLRRRPLCPRRHVPGSNAIGPVHKDEELFAKEEVVCVGQVIGVVVAASEAVAREAAKRVKVGGSGCLALALLVWRLASGCWGCAVWLRRVAALCGCTAATWCHMVPISSAPR